MKRNLSALFIVLFIALHSLAQFNYERKQKFDFTDDLGGFAPAEINKDGRPDLVFFYFDQNYIAYRLNVSPDPVYLNIRYDDMKRIQLEKVSSKRSLYICDINNDTFDDILFSEYDNSRIGIAINNKQSQFNDIYYFNSGSKPTKILSADFNKDQLMDLAVICEESKQMQVYLGNSSSKLGEPVSYSLSGTPSDMELKDVNNDGSTDIMVADNDNNKLQLFTGNGDGTFTKGLTIATNTSPSNLEIADFDGDQLPDVAVNFNNLLQVQVFYQRENHTFSEPATGSTSNYVSALDFIVQDFNEDGLMDMAIRNKSDQIEFLLGKSGNLFSNVQTKINVDGNMSVPLGFFMKPVYYPNKLTFLCLNLSAANVIVRALNADLTLNWSQSGMVCGSEVFYKMDIEDMNGDNIKDLIFNYNAANCLELHYGKSDQSYQYVKTIPLQVDATEIKVSDLNKDGFPDIIASSSNTSEVLINDGANNFQSTIINNVGYANILVVDVNNNGNPDLFLNSNLYMDVKDGDYTKVTSFVTNSVSKITAMDFNHDGNADLCVNNWDNSRILIYPGKGDGTFDNKIIISGQFSSLAVGDVDKDGYDDIVAYISDQMKLVLYRNNKNGGFTQEVIRQNYLDLYNIYILDLDNDGNEDIALPCSGNALKYYPIKPDGTIAAEKLYSGGEVGTCDIRLTDMDNDGNKDLFLLSVWGLDRHSNKIKAQLTLKNTIQSYDGFQVDDMVDKTVPAGLNTSVKFNGQLTRPKNAGTYKAQISISDDLYKGTIDTVLVVNKAPLTVKPLNKVKDYGTANPALKIEYSGFVNSEAADFIDQAPTVSCSADVNSAAGSYPIVVSGGSDNNYQLNYENGTLTINKVKLTVKPDNATRKYGEKDPSFAFSYSGFVNNETASVIDKAPVVKSLATFSSPAGVYDLTVSAGEDNNYDFEYQKGSFTIEKAPLTIKADNKTKTYGNENPKLSLTATGFVNNEGMEVIDQLPLASTLATRLTPVGSYDIALSSGMDNNYQLELQKGILTVDKAPLSIKAEHKSKTYGQENPSYTLTATGFVNFESMEVIDQLPTANSDASKFSSVGTYDIALSGGMDNNYQLELQKGILTVDKAPLTIKAEDQYKRRGEDNPDLTFKATGFANNEGIEVIDQLPVTSTLAGKDSPAGNYSIDLSGGYDNNYELIFVSGNLKIDFAMALNGTSASQVKIYPVPARETVYVENMEDNFLLLQLVDMNGSVVKTVNVNHQTRLSIPVGDLAPGFYFLQGEDKDHNTKRYKLTIN